MIIKIIALLFFLAIFYSLGSALYYMAKRGNSPKKMVKALTWRISLSITLFILLLIAVLMGWLTPPGITP